jgi:hypothetical protein
MVDVDKVLDELNENVGNWTWWAPGDDIYLGSCFHFSRHINCHLVKEDKTIDDVMESWRTEKLHIECKAALFILGRRLIYEKYGSEYCNANRDKFHFLDGANNRDALNSLPFMNDFTPVEEGKISNALFQTDRGSKLDYRYIKGTVMHTMRDSHFPLLDSSFQGENTLLYDPAENLYIAFLRDVKDDMSHARFKIESLETIHKQLVENSRNDFMSKYPDTLYDVEKLCKLQGLQNFTRTVLSYDQVYELKNGKYQEK